MLQGDTSTSWVYGIHTNILIISLFVNFVLSICCDYLLVFERGREREREINVLWLFA